METAPMYTDRWSDMRKLTGAFRVAAKAPISLCAYYIQQSVSVCLQNQCSYLQITCNLKCFYKKHPHEKKVKIKVKFTLEQATKGHALSLTSALDVGGWSTPRPDRFSQGKTRYPLYRRLGGPQGRSGWVWKISPLPGFDPRTVQCATSLYTD